MSRRERRDRRDYKPALPLIETQIANKQEVLAEVLNEIAQEPDARKRSLLNLEASALAANISILSKKQIENERRREAEEELSKTARALRDHFSDSRTAA